MHKQASVHARPAPHVHVRGQPLPRVAFTQPDPTHSRCSDGTLRKLPAFSWVIRVLTNELGTCAMVGEEKTAPVRHSHPRAGSCPRGAGGNLILGVCISPAFQGRRAIALLAWQGSWQHSAHAMVLPPRGPPPKMPLPSGIPIPTPAPFQIPVAPSQDSQHPLLPPPKILTGPPAPRVPGLPSPASGPQRADTHSDSRVGERISGRSTEPSHRALSLEQEQLRGHFPFGGLQASPTPSPASSSSSRTPAPPMPPDPRRGSSFSLPSQLGPGLGHYISHARRPSMPPAGTPCPGFSLLSVSLQPVFLPLCLQCLNFCLCLFPCFCVSLLFCISDSVSLVPTLYLCLSI